MANYAICLFLKINTTIFEEQISYATLVLHTLWCF